MSNNICTLERLSRVLVSVCLILLILSKSSIASEPRKETTSFPSATPNVAISSVKIYPNIRTDKALYKNNEAVSISGNIFSSDKGTIDKREYLVQIVAIPEFEAPTVGLHPEGNESTNSSVASTKFSNNTTLGFGKNLMPARVIPKKIPGIQSRNFQQVQMILPSITLMSKDGSFSTNELVIQVPEFSKWSGFRSRYNITASVIPVSSNQEIYTLGFATKTILVEELGWSKIGLALCLPMLIGLAIPISIVYVLSMQPTKRAATFALWGVYLFGLIALAMTLGLQPLFSLSPGTEAFLRTTPVALAKATTEHRPILHWLIEIGGTITPLNKAEGGFEVPFYVLILAMMGGVINMFLKLPEFVHWYHDLMCEKDIPKAINEVREFRSAICTYFVYILSAPFLALVVYGFMAIADYTNVYIVGIVSSSVGFTSSKIVLKLVGYTEDIIKRFKPNTAQA